MTDLLDNPVTPASASSSAHRFLFDVIRDRAVLRAEDQPLLGSNGRPLDWLMDLRIVMNEAEALDAIAELFWQAHAQHLPFQVGGMEMAAVPLVSAILMKGAARGTPVNGFVVRKERKLYGAGNIIEGRLSRHPIILVDDILNSGQSFEKVLAILEAEGRRADRLFAVVDFESQPGLAWRARRALPIACLFRRSEFGLRLGPGQMRPESLVRQPLFEEVWVHRSPDPNVFLRAPKSFPATDGERVYFGSDSGVFWALDAQGGQVRWTFKVHTRGRKNIYSAPALHDGRVFFGGYDGCVYCLDARTGAMVWSFGEADAVGSSPALAPDLGLLFIGLDFTIEGQKGGILALDLETGERVWQHRTRRYTHASPAYWPERRLMACGSNDDEMFLFDAPTGRILWRFQTRGEGRKGSIRHAPAFDTRRGQLITGCADGYIYVIDVETGQEVWSVRTDNEIYSVPLVAGDRAYVGSTDRQFYILDLGRRELARSFFTRTKLYTPPRLIEGLVYFGGCDGGVRQLDPETGTVCGFHQLPDALTNAIAFDEATGLFYVLDNANVLHALRLKPAAS